MPKNVGQCQGEATQVTTQSLCKGAIMAHNSNGNTDFLQQCNMVSNDNWKIKNNAKEVSQAKTEIKTTTQKEDEEEKAKVKGRQKEGRVDMRQETKWDKGQR
ncbi:hypothetical protein TYRP_009792 [Tyrophagus putrescentiae]|nr:hypothetical protein TYRP_009792 [Tyrophagus putrescentiae]